MFKICLYFVLAVIASVSFAEEKLVFSVDVIRHGDRTPLIMSPALAKMYPQGAGQLTPKGMHQEYELGKLLRKQYIEKHHLLPEKYDINLMQVRSSGLPRTLMSAQSILMGLYPLGTGPALDGSTKALPEGFQPIPINTAPTVDDSLLIPDNSVGEYNKLKEKYILNSRAWMQKNEDLKINYPKWSKLFNAKINNLFDIIDISDRLFIEKLYNVPLPSGAKEQDVAAIFAAGKWALLYVYTHPELSLIAGKELAKTIQQQVYLAKEGKNPLKYYLFVAHDTTLLVQLKLLEQNVEELPPYASRLNYALWHVDGDYVVKVTFNQKPLYIKSCGGDSCSLDAFTKL